MGWLNSLFGGKPAQPATPEEPFFDADGVPRLVRQRLADSKSGALPWVSTLTAPEMALARSHGLRMIAPIAATCWMHYGFSWTRRSRAGLESGFTAASERGRCARCECRDRHAHGHG